MIMIDSCGTANYVISSMSHIHVFIYEKTFEKVPYLHTFCCLHIHYCGLNCRHGFFMNKYDDIFKLQNAIAGISYEYGNTNTAEGLRLVRDHYFNDANGDRTNIQDFRKSFIELHMLF